MGGGNNLGAIGSGGAFGGFEAADFDAFAKKKWSSNAYTLERRQAKDRLLALVRAVQDELEDELSTLELGATDEAPSVANGRKVQAQWAFFTRAAPERAALKTLLNRTDLASGASLFDIAVHHQHACLQLRLDEDGLAIGMEIAGKATVDRDNATKKLEHKWARDKLQALAKELPNGARVGLGEDAVEAIDLDAEAVERWAKALPKSGDRVFAEAVLGRDEEVLASDALIGTAVECVAGFLPMLEFLAWSRDNDHTQVKDAIKEQKKVAEERAATLEPGSRVTILAGLFAGRGGYVAEVQKGKAKVMVGPVSVTVDVKDLKGT